MNGTIWAKFPIITIRLNQFLPAQSLQLWQLHPLITSPKKSPPFKYANQNTFSYFRSKTAPHSLCVTAVSECQFLAPVCESAQPLHPDNDQIRGVLINPGCRWGRWGSADCMLCYMEGKDWQVLDGFLCRMHAQWSRYLGSHWWQLCLNCRTSNSIQWHWYSCMHEVGTY